MQRGLLKGVWKAMQAPTDINRFYKPATLKSRLGAGVRYVSSFFNSRQRLADMEGIRAYTLFLGHARSGGSLLGALIDAHPQAVIGDEVDIFNYIEAGFSREQIFQVLIERSIQQAAKGKTKSGLTVKEYSYKVPGAWQGQYTNLEVIGNRKAGISTRRIAKDMALLDRLEGMLAEIPVVFIAAIRNPYDTITTMNLRSGRDLENGILQYFTNCEAIAAIRNRFSEENVLTVRHERLLADPRTQLREVCDFLGLEIPENYLETCEKVLFRSPSVTRTKIDWSAPMIDLVKQKVESYDFLHGYTFEEGIHG